MNRLLHLGLTGCAAGGCPAVEHRGCDDDEGADNEGRRGEGVAEHCEGDEGGEDDGDARGEDFQDVVCVLDCQRNHHATKCLQSKAMMVPRFCLDSFKAILRKNTKLFVIFFLEIKSLKKK